MLKYVDMWKVLLLRFARNDVIRSTRNDAALLCSRNDIASLCS